METLVFFGNQVQKRLGYNSPAPASANLIRCKIGRHPDFTSDQIGTASGTIGAAKRSRIILGSMLFNFK